MPDELARRADAPLGRLSAAADTAATRTLFTSYRQRRAARTVASQDDDLARWAAYLQTAGYGSADCAWSIEPACWAGISWGLVSGFVQWQADQGYAVASINRALATIKQYAKLAFQAGTLSGDQYQAIRALSGYSAREGRRLDQQRDQTRIDQPGAKKATHTLISPQQAATLKRQPDTPQGRRDAVMLCLLLDHGLRVGELAGVEVRGVDLKRQTITFDRPKVDRMQTHTLTADSARALRAYMQQDAPAIGPLLLGSHRSGTLRGTMSTRSINERVGVIGRTVGIAGLSPHDCRHYWATQAARNGTPLDRLMDAGGWASPAMPLRYIEDAAIANTGVLLDPPPAAPAVPAPLDESAQTLLATVPAARTSIRQWAEQAAVALSWPQEVLTQRLARYEQPLRDAGLRLAQSSRRGTLALVGEDGTVKHYSHIWREP